MNEKLIKYNLIKSCSINLWIYFRKLNWEKNTNIKIFCKSEIKFLCKNIKNYLSYNFKLYKILYILVKKTVNFNLQSNKLINIKQIYMFLTYRFNFLKNYL